MRMQDKSTIKHEREAIRALGLAARKLGMSVKDFTFKTRGSKMSEKKVKLGDELRDKVSGFVGVAIAQHDYLNGCTRFSLQPAVDKDGKLPETASFDEPQLELVKKEKAVAETGANKTGGPDKYMPSARPE